MNHFSNTNAHFRAISLNTMFNFPREAQGLQVLVMRLKDAFEGSKGTYGSPRILEELKAQGYAASENSVARYMREMGLNARPKKRYRARTTDSKHDGPTAPRLFKTGSEGSLPSAPGRLLAGDITYLRLGGGFLYLAVVLDVFNREVVGWSMDGSLETGLVLHALEGAIGRVGTDAKIVFHSDRGCQYASEAYRHFLEDKGITPSMSRRGNCYDNAHVESWFASLKKEWLYRRAYSTERELRGLVFEYIEVWYNKKRRHSALDYMSPEGYKTERKKCT